MSILIPCPTCSGTRTITHGDRHAETRQDVCPTCAPYEDAHPGRVPAQTGETREASFVSGPDSDWLPMSSAPKGETKIDLLFPAPRGRQNDCFWGASRLHGAKTWIWRTPTWDHEKPMNLLPEEQWTTHCYPNMKPLGWRRPPNLIPPASSS